MKNICYSVLAVFALLSMNCCQDLESPLNTVPNITTDAVKHAGTSAYISGRLSSKGECYFLVSLSEDMNEAKRVETYSYQSEEDAIWHCGAELYELEPGTTYYVVLCATDGRSEVRGNVVSFTTSSYLTIESVYMADGEPYTNDILGVYLANANQHVFEKYGNQRALRNGWTGDGNPQKYDLPYNFMITEPTTVYAYIPWNEKSNPDVLNQVPVRSSAYRDYQYGSCTVTSENPKANIEMHSAMARLQFILSADAEVQQSFQVWSIELENTSDAGPLFNEGMLDLTTGNVTSTGNSGSVGRDDFNGIDLYTGGKSITAEVLVFPISFTDGELSLHVRTSAGEVEVPIPGATWEKGKTYEIPVTVNTRPAAVSTAHIGDYYYSDGTWSTTFNNDKECIGVVFALSEEKGGAINPWLQESNHGRIVSLQDINAGEKYPWGNYIDMDIIPNFSLLDGVHNKGELPFNGQSTTNETLPYSMSKWLTNVGEQYALTDYNGFIYSDCYGFDDRCLAIWMARSEEYGLYWYLPALGELARLGMACAAGYIPKDAQLTGDYWSSTECNLGLVWVYRVHAGNNHNDIVERYEKENDAMLCRIRRIACF